MHVYLKNLTVVSEAIFQKWVSLIACRVGCAVLKVIKRVSQAPNLQNIYLKKRVAPSCSISSGGNSRLSYSLCSVLSMYASKPSKSRWSNCPKPCIHVHASCIASGSSLHHFTLPRRSCWMSLAFVKTLKCFEIAAKDISKGSATSVTAISSSNSIDKICLRVGSASAENIRSNDEAIVRLILICIQSSTKWLNINFGLILGYRLSIQGGIYKNMNKNSNLPSLTSG